MAMVSVNELGLTMNINKKRTGLPYVTGRDGHSCGVHWGDTVRIDFMVWLEDGTLIDSSVYSTPLIFTVGMHSVMQGIERLVIGMSIGESRTEKLPADSAFGPYRPELSYRVSRSWFQAQAVEPQIGLGLDVRKVDRTLMHMIVTGLDRDHVTLDANHRLAGKDLLVQLDLLEILDHTGSGLCVTPTPQA
jgi:peptidylprolyl isomerase